MMTKLFDITPRKKIPSIPQQSKEYSESGKVFFLVVIMAVVVFAFSIMQNDKIQTNSEPKQESPEENEQLPNQTGSNKTIISDQTANPISDNSAFSIDLPSNINIDQQANQNSSSENKNTEIDKSQVKIRILNGSGRSGMATQTKKILEKDGFKISSIGTARNIYSKTVIYYNQGKEAESRLVAGSLADENVKFEENSQLTGTYDLLIVVGRE